MASRMCDNRGATTNVSESNRHSALGHEAFVVADDAISPGLLRVSELA